MPASFVSLPGVFPCGDNGRGRRGGFQCERANDPGGNVIAPLGARTPPEQPDSSAKTIFHVCGVLCAEHIRPTSACPDPVNLNRSIQSDAGAKRRTNFPVRSTPPLRIQRMLGDKQSGTCFGNR